VTLLWDRPLVVLRCDNLVSLGWACVMSEQKINHPGTPQWEHLIEVGFARYFKYR
jgi:hypothetical protein